MKRGQCFLINVNTKGSTEHTSKVCNVFRYVNVCRTKSSFSLMVNMVRYVRGAHYSLMDEVERK